MKPGEDGTAEQDQQEELQRRVVEDVEKGLAKPGKTYSQNPNVEDGKEE